MTTAVIQIGNSDDKLNQRAWADFCRATHELATTLGQVHFSGASNGWEPWQNACFVVELSPAAALFTLKDWERGWTTEQVLRDRLGRLAHLYGQDSIALVAGETYFVKASRR